MGLMLVGRPSRRDCDRPPADFPLTGPTGVRGQTGTRLASAGSGGSFMPTYAFYCSQCKATFELIASMAEHERMKKEKTLKCSSCGSSEVVPQVTTFEVRTSRKSA
jgi:putative FmdB family regulatory protein